MNEISSVSASRAKPTTSWLSRPRVALLALCAVASFGVVLGVRSFASEYSSYDVPRRASRLEEEWRGATRPESVEIPGIGWRGSWIQGAREEVIVLLHGFAGCRDDLLPEMRMLSDVGYTVLSLDLPGHGQSAGSTTLGEDAVFGLKRVHRFAAERAGVSLQRVGALGFSAGGFVLLRESLDDPDWGAVVVSGTPMDVTDFLRLEHGRWGAISYWSAYAAMLARGVDPETMRLGSQLRHRKDVPLLVVVGDRDTVVPPFLSLPVFENARGTKLLLELEEASHGDYSRTSSRYAESLLRFFETHVRGSRGA